MLSVGSYPLMEQISVDDVDGAINVPLDLSFVSLTSPLSSPPQASWALRSIHSGPTLASGGGGTGNPFVAPPIAEDDSMFNVAGWIDDERFHPDFLLQAVKPYADVEADIKRAMRMEPTPTGSNSWSGANKWVTVSEVLIADTKKLKLKRLRLRRRTKSVMSSPHQQHHHLHQHPHQHPHHHHHHQYQRYLHQHPSGVITPEEEHYEEDDGEEEEVFEEEEVYDVDDTLATAIETVIAAEARAPADDDEYEGRGFGGLGSGLGSGACGCKCAVLGALQRVADEVVVNGHSSGGEAGVQHRWGGNVLTEGVGRWICGVEEAA